MCIPGRGIVSARWTLSQLIIEVIGSGGLRVYMTLAQIGGPAYMHYRTNDKSTTSKASHPGSTPVRRRIRSAYAYDGHTGRLITESVSIYKPSSI